MGLSGAYREIAGAATVADDVSILAEPVVRVFYVKGARLDVPTQAVVGPARRRFDFKAWSPEPAGRLVMLVDPGKSAPPVTLKLTSVKAAE